LRELTAPALVTDPQAGIMVLPPVPDPWPDGTPPDRRGPLF